jgi:hypothetical protein
MAVGQKVPPQTAAESKAAYAAVAERSKGLCEGCGRKPAAEMHHRLYRSQGGRDEITNLLHLCGRGNTSGCHGVAHTGPGREAGWSVHWWATPAEVPVNYRLGGLKLLGPDGSIDDIERRRHGTPLVPR